MDALLQFLGWAAGSVIVVWQILYWLRGDDWLRWRQPDGLDRWIEQHGTTMIAIAVAFAGAAAAIGCAVAAYAT
jgi:hypothetical protein